MSLKKQINDRPWILAVGVVALVAVWMWSGVLLERPAATTESSVASTQSDESAPTRVKVSRQTAEMVTRYISINGATAPARSVEMNAETDGRVEMIAARRGEPVKKGAVILRLDLRDRQARLDQAKASVKEHQTAYEGQLKLKADGYVSDTQIAQTQSLLESARAELTRAQLDLEYRTVRAPFDGVLQEREVEIGDFVRSGDTVATFIDNTSIIVTGTIAEQDARFVDIDTRATARLVTGQAIEGRIRYVAPVADASTRTFLVEMEAPNPTGKLPSGVTAELRIPAEQMLAQRISPSLLSLDSNGIIGVKTVDDLNRVVFTPVEIARSETNGVWVTGLPEISNVITVGQGYVGSGQEVDPVFEEGETALAAERMQ